MWSARSDSTVMKRRFRRCGGADGAGALRSQEKKRAAIAVATAALGILTDLTLRVRSARCVLFLDDGEDHADQLRERARRHLLHDVRAVDLDRLRAEPQRVADRLV